MLGGSGHRDVAVDCSFNAGTKRLRIGEDDQVELVSMTQAIPSASAVSQVSRVEPSGIEPARLLGNRLLEAGGDGREVPVVVGDQGRVALATRWAGSVNARVVKVTVDKSAARPGPCDKPPGEL